MPNGHQLPHQNMRDDHDDPFDAQKEAVSEKDSFARNPYPPDGKLWFAWREGWLERMRWEQERAAAIVRKGRRT